MRNLYKPVIVRIKHDGEDGAEGIIEEAGRFAAMVLPPSVTAMQLGIARGVEVQHIVMLPYGACASVKRGWVCIDGNDYQILNRRETTDHIILEIGRER